MNPRHLDPQSRTLTPELYPPGNLNMRKFSIFVKPVLNLPQKYADIRNRGIIRCLKTANGVNMIYEKCRDILLREFELIQNAAVIQEKIQQAVIGRDWVKFEDSMSVMNSIESKMDGLETEREQLFDVYETILHQKSFSKNLDSKGRFYKLVSILPEEQRIDLSAIYRSLKMEALKLRMANDTLMTYLIGIKATLKDFFDLAFPDRAGNIYTNQGSQLSHDMRSMVLNTQF